MSREPGLGRLPALSGTLFGQAKQLKKYDRSTICFAEHRPARSTCRDVADQRCAEPQALGKAFCDVDLHLFWGPGAAKRDDLSEPLREIRCWRTLPA
jgi:hypothetical protein